MLLTALALAGSAFAEGPALAASLSTWVAQTCSARSVEVRWVGLEDQWPGADFVWEGQPCRERPTLKLTVLDGEVILDRRTVRPGLGVLVDVPVAVATAAPGELVRTTPGAAWIQDLRGEPVGEGEWRARVTIKAGEPVTDALVEQMPDVLSGTPVTLNVHRGALTVSAPGRLLEDGHLGREVRVVNDATRVALEGVLVSPSTVEIP
jgi:flagella basal body P-ring formation protein FlgA